METAIFNKFGNIGTRKLMTFNRVTDFEFDVAYAKYSGSGMDSIAKVKVTGLTEAMKKHKDDIKASEIPPKVRVTFELSSSGIVSIPEAALHIGKLTFKEKVKSFFGGKDSKEEPEKKEDEANKQNETSSEDIKNANATEDVKESVSIIKIPLEIEYTPVGLIPLRTQDKVNAKKRIQELDALDTRKKLLEESRNALESFVYRVQDFLYDDIVALVATEETIENLRERLSEVSDWIYDEGEHADTPVFKSKLKELQLIEQPIQHRFREYKQRDKNIEMIESNLKRANDFLASIRALGEEERYHTEAELEELVVAIEKLEDWKNDKVETQKKLALTEDPVFITSHVLEKLKSFEEQFMKLVNKKKPKVSKKAPESTKADTKEEAETATSNEQKETQSSAPEDVNHDEL